MVETVKEYILNRYGVHPNCPWSSAPEHMTFKEKSSDKWFALIMHLDKKSVGIDEPGDIWVMNVKASPDFIMMIAGTAGYTRAYHMNKEHWITVFLDGSVPMKQVYNCIDVSYSLIVNTPTKRIYEAVKQIPKGKVATYKTVAKMAGNDKMCRAVGNALHKNPDPDNIPCYRVVNSKGELAKSFVFGGDDVQRRLLEAEGVEVVNGVVDLKKFGI